MDQSSINVVTAINSILAMIGTAVAIFLAVRKAPVEMRKDESSSRASDASAAKSFAEAAKLAADSAIQESQGLKDCREDLQVVKSISEELLEMIGVVMVLFKNLSGQVIQLGGEPMTLPNNFDERLAALKQTLNERD